MLLKQMQCKVTKYHNYKDYITTNNYIYTCVLLIVVYFCLVFTLYEQKHKHPRDITNA